MKTRKYTIEGVAPLLMHNSRLANPFDPIAQQLKVVSSRRNKKDEDYRKMAEMEFFGGLCLDENGAPCITGEQVEISLKQAAAKRRMGTIAKYAIMSNGNFPLVYKGPNKPEELWNDMRFVDQRSVVVQRARVIRTRPVFPQWKAHIEVSFDEEEINERDVDWMVETAGKKIGIGDFRPKFGRFKVVKPKNKLSRKKKSGAKSKKR